MLEHFVSLNSNKTSEPNRFFFCGCFHGSQRFQFLQSLLRPTAVEIRHF